MDEKRKSGREKGKFSIDVNDIIGKHLGKLEVKDYSHHCYDLTQGGERVRHYYKCQCSCGYTKLIRRDSLIGERARSCGFCNSNNGGVKNGN